MRLRTLTGLLLAGVGSASACGGLVEERSIGPASDRADGEEHAAWGELLASCDTEPASDVVRTLGMPSAAEGRALVAALLQVELRAA